MPSHFFFKSLDRFYDQTDSCNGQVVSFESALNQHCAGSSEFDWPKKNTYASVDCSGTPTASDKLSEDCEDGAENTIYASQWYYGQVDTSSGDDDSSNKDNTALIAGTAAGGGVVVVGAAVGAYVYFGGQAAASAAGGAQVGSTMTN
jgi:hypothetical protein